jgi:Protein of unknown function (DUF3500)
MTGQTMNRKALLVAAVILIGASIVFAMQRGGGRSGVLPTYYKGISTPLSAVDTTASDRACGASVGHERLVCLAALLKRDMNAALLARLQLPYAVADAQRWSNFPPMGYRNRVGVTLGELTPAQRGAVKALMKEAAGMAAGEGYDEIEQILNADDFLRNNTNDTGFASGNFQVAFLGTPGSSGTWQLYFGGHHLAFGTTYTDGKMTGATPSFRGVEPFTPFRENGRDNAPMAQEQAAFAAMLGALSQEEHTKARLAQTYTDLVVGPQRDNSFPSARAGARVGAFTQETQASVVRAIETYVRDINPPDADAILAKYRAELAETFVAYSGTPSMNAENDYVRIDGPSVWIELSMQGGRSLPGIHPHSVWRDRKTDYGGNK